MTHTTVLAIFEKNWDSCEPNELIGICSTPQLAEIYKHYLAEIAWHIRNPIYRHSPIESVVQEFGDIMDSFIVKSFPLI